ncbi:MAG: hypothetical protein JWO90_1240 [Solirubrobacterales bacterium]|jgi:hypothetical protein|nr:hypothetical protein [Solirubrobacterales bacterium]
MQSMPRTGAFVRIGTRSGAAASAGERRTPRGPGRRVLLRDCQEAYAACWIPTADESGAAPKRRLARKSDGARPW